MLRVRPQNWAIRPQVSMARSWAALRRSRALRGTGTCASAAELRRAAEGDELGLRASGELPARGGHIVAARVADVDGEARGADRLLEGVDPLRRGAREGEAL